MDALILKGNNRAVTMHQTHDSVPITISEDEVAASFKFI